MDSHQSKVMRAPSLKRGKQDERAADRFKLEHVLGVTVTSNSALTCDPGTHLVAYPSGCTIVLFNTRTGKQHGHFVNACRKTITACSFSSDGRYLVTGECGHMPYVRIWDLQHEATTTTGSAAIQIAEFQGHQYGVNCVAFSPSNKYVVSVGSQHDMIVNVWDWKANVKVASNKVSTKVKAVAFAENGSYFVTVGNRHVKFWYLEYSRGSSRIKEAVPLVGRAAILGSQRGQHFVAVACGRGEAADNTYAVTRSGLLCQLNNRRLLEKWLELRTTSANCMTVSETFIFVGCADGIVRCFDPVSLHFITTLPRTHHLGVDVSLGLSIAHMSSHPNNARYPDTVAVAYDNNYKLICVYNDHSVYVWDVRDIKRVGKSQSFLYHSACIWGIEMYPTRDQIAQYRTPAPELLPEGSFITCSSDDTIRIWNLTGDPIPSTHPIQRNIYSNELLKIIYVDPELNYIKDQDLTLTGDNKDSSYDGKNGVRSIRISPDGLHLASGDRAGNIRIYDMRTMRELIKIEAHDAEVLCLEYSQNSPEQTGYPRLLASASRDRLIHVFNVDDDYSILQSIDDHSSSITAVRFISSGRQLQMISCGADKSIIFRQLGGSAGETELTFQRGHNVACRTTLYDMEVEASGRHILTACQDRSVRVYSSRSGRHARSLRGSPSDDGSLIKITLDSGGRYMATSCTDKTLSVYCAWSGQLLGTMSGHSELATGLRFMTGGRRLVSASGDASVLVWKQAQKKADTGLGDIDLDSEFGISTPDIFDPSVNNTDVPDYRFSVGPLPLWAKKQITDDSSPPSSLTRNVDMPRGRWAQRVDSTGIAVKSIYDSDSIIQFPGLQDKRQDSDGSKESSMDSGNESRNHSDHRRENVSLSKQKLSENLRRIDGPSIGNKTGIIHHTDDSSLGSLLGSSAPGGDTGESAAEHDGDVEDCSDAEPPLVATKYYPNIAAIDSPSEFTVNAMDVEELRKSQRKNKNRPDIISISTTSVSGSQESDFDDDDASTPSGDNGDKNLMSLFSASTESIDKIGQREKYIQSAFDSLSGVEQDSSQNKSSLSAQHYITRLNWSNIPARNVDVVKEVKQAKIENDSKRDELKRRIEETKRKLQSVGYKSNLKLSQSMLDLSPIPERDRRPTSKHKIPVVPVDDELENSLRRACSLSDLANPAPVKTKHSPGKHVNPPRTNQRYTKSANMTRSSSVDVLNASDSETESGQQNGGAPRPALRTSLMRPTISSQNKVTVNKNTARRRTIQSSYSTVNLSTVGQEDSSSEELPSSGKPNGAPRPRTANGNGTEQSAPQPPQRRPKDASYKIKGSRSTSNLERFPMDVPVKDGTFDISTSQLSTQLCNQIAEQLMKTADNVVQLYKRLTLNDSASDDSSSQDKGTTAAEKSDMLKNLEGAIVETQRTLQMAIKQQQLNNDSALTVNHNQTVNQLKELVSLNSSEADDSKIMLMMQQYSDILLKMMQEKMLSKN